MSGLAYQQQAAAILYAVLGTKATISAFDQVGAQFESGTLSSSAYVQNLLSSSQGVALYQGKSTSDVVQAIYTTVYGQA
ncbi:hypothetical protein ACXQGN_001127, partial [Serratia marcescens]